MYTSGKIKSLAASFNPSEKGYAKKFAKTALDDSASRKIDILLDSFEISSEEDARWIYDFLMKSLEEYHKNPLSEIRGMLNQIDLLLIDKDLPDQAEKLIIRAKKAAAKINATSMLMEISELESALLAIKPPSDELITRLEKTFEDLQELTDEHDSFIFEKIKQAESS